MSFKNLIQSHKTYISIIFILTLFFSLAAIQFPLLNILGFEYSIAHSILFVIVSGHSAIFLLNRKIELTAILQLQFVFLLIPIVVGLINSFFVKNCSLIEGFEFYFLFTVISSIFGLSLGALVTSLIKKFRYLFFVLLFIFIFGWSLWIYYISPQLYLFNPIFGYFPGFVYDEEIFISRTILNYRFSILCISVLLISFSVMLKRIKDGAKRENLLPILLLGFIGIVLISVLIFFADSFGYGTSQAKLKKAFSKKIETSHFNIFLSKDSVSVYQEKLLSYQSEIVYEDLRNYFQVELKDKIDIFIFESNDAKRNLLGTAVADFTKPWLKQIFLTEENFADVIKHELAHIFAGEFSDNIFKSANGLNLGLIEGTAMAAEWNWLDNSLHFYSANIYRFIGEIEPTVFFKNLTFATKPSSLSYVLCGSFVRYLIDEYGIERFKKLYSTGDFSTVYGKSKKLLADEYISFVKKFPIDKRDSLSTIYYFQRDAISDKPCLRYIAVNIRKGFELIKEKNYVEAETLFRELWAKVESPGNAYAYMLSLFYQKRINDCVKFFEKNFGRKNFNPKFIQAYLVASNAYALSDKVVKAKNILNMLSAINLSGEYLNGIETRKILIEHKNILEQLLFSDDKEEVVSKILNQFRQNVIVYRYLFNYLDDEQKQWLFVKDAKNFNTIERAFYWSLERFDFDFCEKILRSAHKIFLNEIQMNKTTFWQNLLSRFTP